MREERENHRWGERQTERHNQTEKQTDREETLWERERGYTH